MTQVKKEFHYATKLTQKVAEIFDEDGSVFIDQKELQEGENLKHFLHALTNIMPNHFFNAITGENKNLLEFNHTANKLVFEYMKKNEEA